MIQAGRKLRRFGSCAPLHGRARRARSRHCPRLCAFARPPPRALGAGAVPERPGRPQGGRHTAPVALCVPRSSPLGAPRLGGCCSSPQNHAFVHSRPRCARCVRHKSGGFVQRFGGRVALPLLLPRSGGRPGTSPPSPRPARSRSHGRARATPRPGSRPPATPRSPILSKSPVSVKGTCARGAQGRTAPP